MVAAFTITDINYLMISVFRDVVLPLSCLYLGYQVLLAGYALYSMFFPALCALGSEKTPCFSPNV